jgi:hypothetical protein
MVLAIRTLSLAIVLTLAPSAVAKTWRGITPLQSSRSDVVRLLGFCKDSEQGCVFDLNGQNVYILFASGATTAHECARQLPADMVLLIEVKLKTGRPLTRLRIDKKNLRAFENSAPPTIGHKGYIDETNGLVIKTFKGRVYQLDYIAAAKDVHRCATYYEDPETFGRVFIEYLPPSVSVACPTESLVAGDKLICTATTSGRPRYEWHLSAGRILEGQGTPKITIDTTGLGGQKLTVTVERHYLREPIAAATTEVLVPKAPD